MRLGRRQRSRDPDWCWRHPLKETVRSTTRRAFPDCRREHRLVQHDCGEGCGRYLGWEFHGPDGEFRSGRGKCRNERILRAMEQAERDEDHKWRTAALVCMPALAGVIAGILLITTGTTWGKWFGILAISAGGAAILLALFGGPEDEMPEPDRG